MPTDRFRIVGYAENRPLVPNDSRENRARNRRVEIVLLNPTTPFAQPAAAKPGAEPTAAAAIPTKPNPDAKPGATSVKPPSTAAKPALPVIPPQPTAAPRANPGESPFLTKPSGFARSEPDGFELVAPPVLTGRSDAPTVPGVGVSSGSVEKPGQPIDAQPPVSIGAPSIVKPGQIQPVGPPPVIITGPNATNQGSPANTTQPGPRGVSDSQPPPVSIGPAPVNILPQFGGPPAAPRP